MLKNRYATLLLLSTFVVSQSSALTLKEAQEKAILNATELKKIEHNIEIARYKKEQKNSLKYGEFDIVGSYTHYNLPRTLTPLTPSSMKPDTPSTEDMLSFGISYSVNLFTGFAQTRDIEIASLQEDMAQNYKTLGKNEILYNVKTLYISILLQEAQKRAQEEYLKALESLHSDVELKVKLGSAAKIEELKSLADVKHTQSRITSIETNIEILKENLATLMMVDKFSPLEDIDIEIDENSVFKISDYIDKLKDSTQLKVVETTVKQREKMIQKSDALYYPKVALNAYYGLNGGVNDSSNPNSGDFDSDSLWQVGVNLKWNIFDFGAKNATSQIAKVSLLDTKLQESSLKRELKRDLVKAMSKIKESIQNYTSASSELSLMEKTQKIEKIRYDNGASDINDLLSTKARYQMALSSFIATKYQYKNAINYLEYIVEQEN
jgi:outer membrane protein TolC